MAAPASVKTKAKPKAKPKPLATFTWEGTDKKGNKTSGETQASNLAAVRADLRKQGILQPKVRKKATPLFSGGKKKITAGDISVFSRQLATMMQAGVPIVQAFDIVGKGHANPSMQDLIMNIKSEVEGGASLANALRKHPIQFDDLFCSLVEAGESAGVLDDLLEKIATFKEKTEAIKAKVKSALTYPISVLVVAVVVMSVLMIFVIPAFKEIFDGFGAELPAFTLFLIGISEFMQAWWWAMLGGVIAFFKSFQYVYQRSAKLRGLMDRLLLKAPVVGVIMEKSAIARFARTLSTIFAAGVPLVEALESVAGATGNIVYVEAVMRMRSMVAEGQSLQSAIKQQDLFPNLVIQMVSIGEESGALDKMLGKVADFYEAEVDNLVDAMSSLMEPVIMVVIGGMVGAMIVGMYLPIFSMASTV